MTDQIWKESEELQDIHFVLDMELVYQTRGMVEGECRIRIYGEPAHLVLISEMQSNKGLSVTNGIESICNVVTARWPVRSNTTYVEHYPKRGTRNHPIDEVFARVDFNITKVRKQFHAPRWSPFSIERIKDIINGWIEVDGKQ